MAKFESKYDIGEVVTHSSEGECKIDSIKVGIDGIDYFIKSDSGFHGWVSECHLKPAPKEIFVAFFDNGTFGVPMSSIKKIDYYYANAISSPYKIMKLVDIEE